MQQADVRLVLADGRKVLADGRVVSEITVPQPAAQTSSEISSGRAAARTLERIHRKLGDLPDLPVKMNPIAAVMTYSAIRLSNADIATALGATEAQIETLKKSEAYKQLAEMFDKTVFEDARQHAKHVIARASGRAASRMVEAIESTDESIAVVAAREVMKTAGVSLQEDTGKSLSGLKIVIERDDATKNDKITVSLNGE